MAYGLEIYGPDDSTLVFGSALRTSNIQVYASYSLTTSNTTLTIACPDANDPSKITIVVLATNVYDPTPGVSTTSTNFTLNAPQVGTRTGVVYAIRRS